MTEAPSRPPRRRRPPRVAVDSILIVFSILLALAVNAWWSGRQDRARVGQALVLLDAEIAANREQVLDLLPYHRQILGMLAELSTSGEAGSVDDLAMEGWEGFQPPRLSQAAWESTLAGGVSTLMDFETVSVLGRVYALLASVDRSTSAGLMAMMGPGAFRPDNFQSTIQLALAYVVDMIYAQESLVQVYGEWIEFRSGSR
jgi:hypothetical protein